MIFNGSKPALRHAVYDIAEKERHNEEVCEA